MRRVCVFAGSSLGRRPSYEAAARQLGGELAVRGIGMVYGGASVGLMGAAADAVLEGSGEVTGVIPTALFERDVVHRDLSELHVVETMHQRKALMAELSDAFIALPGGLGTFEELMEILTWAQLGAHEKPVGVLDVDGYFAPLSALLSHATAERFVRADHAAILLTASSAPELLAAFEAYVPPRLQKWIELDTT